MRLGGMSITGIHHAHEAGEWMTGYSFMQMEMDGSLDGSHGAGRSDIFSEGFMVAPTSMQMQMHMFHLMYSPTSRMTLALMMPLLQKSMDHVVNPNIAMPFAGEKFTTESRGPGDLELSLLLNLYEAEGHRLVADAGWSFPTGSIDEKDETPMSMGSRVRLPYPMQLGSGTFDARPGLTYLGQGDPWSWGTHLGATIRIGENSERYTLGDEWVATAWGARRLTEWFSTSVRLEGRGWGDIDGADPALNPMMVPTADPNRRAGKRLDLLFGVNLFSVDGRLGGNRIALEGGLPVYQNLDGPQLETDWRIQVSWDWTFDSILALGQ